MSIARKHQVDESLLSCFHCISRCVRRAYLCGDAGTVDMQSLDRVNIARYRQRQCNIGPGVISVAVGARQPGRLARHGRDSDQSARRCPPNQRLGLGYVRLGVRAYSERPAGW